MWGDSNPTDTRALWADRLGAFSREDLAHALEAMERAHLDFPPTLPQFCELCRDARARRLQDTKRLIAPRTPMPEHIREQLRAFVKAKTVSP